MASHIKQFRNLDDRALQLAKLVKERKVSQETAKEKARGEKQCQQK